MINGSRLVLDRSLPSTVARLKSDVREAEEKKGLRMKERTACCGCMTRSIRPEKRRQVDKEPKLLARESCTSLTSTWRSEEQERRIERKARCLYMTGSVGPGKRSELRRMVAMRAGVEPNSFKGQTIGSLQNQSAFLTAPSYSGYDVDSEHDSSDSDSTITTATAACGRLLPANNAEIRGSSA